MSEQKPQPVILDRAYVFDGGEGPARLERVAKQSEQLPSGDPYRNTDPYTHSLAHSRKLL